VTSRCVYIGRFQPPHCGHLYVIKWALQYCNELIIVVGSAQESYTLKNPFTAGERLEMLRLALTDEGLDMSRFWLIPLQDIAMNSVWVRYLEVNLPKFSKAVSRNPLVVKLFRDYGYEVLIPPAYRREVCSGTRIRQLMLSNDSRWEKLVTPSVAEYIKRIGGVERIVLLAHGD